MRIHMHANIHKYIHAYIYIHTEIHTLIIYNNVKCIQPFLASFYGWKCNVKGGLKPDIEIYSITWLCVHGSDCFIAFIMIADDFVLFQCYITWIFLIKTHFCT